MDRRTFIMEKILRRVDYVDGPLPTQCWLWTGPTSGSNGRGSGYGRMCLDGGTVAVHRVVWVNYHGYIPPKKQIDHRCRNRLCCNPQHLEMVTHRKNQIRKTLKVVTPVDGFSEEDFV